MCPQLQAFRCDAEYAGKELHWLKEFWEVYVFGKGRELLPNICNILPWVIP
jgi:hypothetical protein